MPPTGPYAKPYLDVPGQIALLRSRGMAITDVPKAQAYLGRIGYYRLSGYWYPYRTSTPAVDQAGQPIVLINEEFRAGTEFRHIVDLYVFDKKLRLLVLDAIERIEVCLRVEIALLLGRQDAHAHRNPARLDPKFTIGPYGASRHDNWIKLLNKAEGRSKEEFVTSFRMKYTNDLPIWMTIELWDFGLLSNFYAGMKHLDRATIASNYGVNQHLMRSWLRSINYIRNICAHHSRLWNRDVVDKPVLPGAGVAVELGHLALHPKALHRIYGILAIIQYLLKRINPTSSWGARLIEHVDAFPQIPILSIQDAGFPVAWKTEALWQ